MTKGSITADVMALLEYLLASSNIRLRPEAKPIVFETPDETWCLDPRAQGALLQRGSATGTLRIRCTADVLVRLITDPDFTLRDDDQASFEGNLDDFLHVANALDEASTVLNVQFARKP